RKDQDREWVLQPAGQIEQQTELQDVVAEAQRCVALAQPGGRLAEQDQQQIQQDRTGDDRERRKKRQAEAETVMNDHNGQRLSGDRYPTNRNEGAQTDPAKAGGGLVRGHKAGIAHRMISSGSLRGEEVSASVGA